MADNINLLPEQSEVVDSKSKQNALINKVSAVILVVTILAVAGVFGYNFIISQSISGLDNEVAEQKAVVDQYKEAEGIERSVAARLQAAEQFLNSQNHYSRALTQINRSMPGGIRLDTLAIASDKAVTLSGNASAYGDLAGFLAKLKTAGDGTVRYFIDPTLTTINREVQSKPITFSATFTLNNTLVVGPTTTEN